jgi:hypothetical protein
MSWSLTVPVVVTFAVLEGQPGWKVSRAGRSAVLCDQPVVMLTP